MNSLINEGGFLCKPSISGGFFVLDEWPPTL